MELAAQRAQRRPLPSLALAALAMWRHPDAEIDITIDQSRARATIQYTKPKSEFPQAWVMLADDDALSVQIQPEERDWPEFGLKSGDVVSSLVFTVPSDAILARSTIEYGSIFGAADDMLQGWFKDRVIVIGDRRSGVDRYPHPDGRDELSGCYGQASAIETGIENVLDGVHRPTKLPIATLRVSVLICSALFGLVIGLVTAGLHLRRYLVLLACAAVLALVSVLVAAGLHWIWNPIVPFLVLFSSCELCSAVHRVRLRRASWLIEEAVK